MKVDQNCLGPRCAWSEDEAYVLGPSSEVLRRLLITVKKKKNFFSFIFRYDRQQEQWLINPSKMSSPDTMPTTYETKTTTQTTTGGGAVGFHPEYLRTIPGILKIVECVSTIGMFFVLASNRLLSQWNNFTFVRSFVEEQNKEDTERCQQIFIWSITKIPL